MRGFHLFGVRMEKNCVARAPPPTACIPVKAPAFRPVNPHPPLVILVSRGRRPSPERSRRGSRGTCCWLLPTSVHQLCRAHPRESTGLQAGKSPSTPLVILRQRLLRFPRRSRHEGSMYPRFRVAPPLSQLAEKLAIRTGHAFTGCGRTPVGYPVCRRRSTG